MPSFSKIREPFFYMEILCKFFPTFKLEIEFYSHKKVVSPKLENCAHLFIVNFKCAKFQKKSRIFFYREEGREGRRSLIIKTQTCKVYKTLCEQLCVTNLSRICCASLEITSRFAAGCIRLPRDPKGEENGSKAQKAFRYQRIR